MAEAGDAPPDARERARNARIARWEWVASAVAAAVVLGLVWMLLREAWSGADLPPDLRVELEAPVVLDGRAHLRFTLANRGGRTASAVGLTLQLRDGDAVVETRRLTVDYVPGRSRATGGFFVDAPREGLVPVVVVDGYVDP